MRFSTRRLFVATLALCGLVNVVSAQCPDCKKCPVGDPITVQVHYLSLSPCKVETLRDENVLIASGKNHQFINRDQLYKLMESSQSDRRTNVMQAPRLAANSGESATMEVTDTQYFVTSMTVKSVNGQVIAVPVNEPVKLGTTLKIIPTRDARSSTTRVDIATTLTSLESEQVPLFPITMTVTPTFEGGFQGQPIPFTQYIQQPKFHTQSVSATCDLCDKHSVVIDMGKSQSERTQVCSAGWLDLEGAVTVTTACTGCVSASPLIKPCLHLLEDRTKTSSRVKETHHTFLIVTVGDCK